MDRSIVQFNVEWLPSSPKRRERTTQIIKNAMRLFAKQGYAATTTRQIADACGINIGTLYHHAGTKSDVLQLAMRYYDHPMKEFFKKYGHEHAENHECPNKSRKRRITISLLCVHYIPPLMDEFYMLCFIKICYYK